MLRKLRIILAICVFGALTAFFLDFSETVPRWFGWLANVQFLPAVMGTVGGLAVSAFVLLALIFLALVFGRVYCSCVCPLGIIQDIIARISRILSCRNNGKYYDYQPPHKKIRHCLALFILLTVFADFLIVPRFSIMTGILDPYACYGRIATHLFYPVYACGNNLIASVTRHFGSFKFYLVPHPIQNSFAFVTATISLVVIGYMAWRYGRFYCNTICPVGMFLGILARHAFFQININREKCVGCRLCAGYCKCSCIDIDRKTVENDRCIVCLNCIDVCKKKAIRYNSPFFKKKPIQVKTKRDSVSSSSSVDLSKRRFLGSTATALLSGSLLGITKNTPADEITVSKAEVGVGGLPISERGNVPYEITDSISPPGSISLDHLASRCTLCHLCIARCPQKVIKPAFLDYGVRGVMLPVLKFSTEVFCNYDCTICGSVCPTGAIELLSEEEKHSTQIGHVVFIKENCVVFTNETNCGACAEHCPTQAVHMIDYKGNLTIPETREQYCVGCGACESICPVIPFKAIHVEGNRVHKLSELPPRQEKVKVEIDDFGF